MSLVISNASPLIALSTVGLLDLLPSLYGTIHIPDAVYDEVVVAGRGQPGSSEVASAPWAVRHAPANPQAVLQLGRAAGLDKGESEAIILAIDLNASLVILDDQAARLYAQSQQLPIIGTVGILLLAKRHKLIASIKQHLDLLIAAGVRIHPLLYTAVLRQAGE